MPKVTAKQIAKSVVFTAIGAAPGIIWFLNAGTTQSIVITCLGAFVALGLSLPGVSAARVVGATAGMIVARNAPSSMQGKIMDAFVGENDAAANEQATNNEKQDESTKTKT